MIVYAVVSYDYEGMSSDSIWSTRELADKRVDTLNHVHSEWETEEITVDEKRPGRKGYRVSVDVNNGELFGEPSAILLETSIKLPKATDITTYWAKTVYKTSGGKYRAKGFEGMKFNVDVPVTKCGYGETIELAIEDARANAKEWVAKQI